MCKCSISSFLQSLLLWQKFWRQCFHNYFKKISRCNLETFENETILLKNLEFCTRSNSILEIFTYELEIDNEYEMLPALVWTDEPLPWGFGHRGNPALS